METQVNSHPIIKRAQVYVGMNGLLGVDIEQRRPIARLNGKKSFYIDNDGKKMPLSTNFSARVPLVEGVEEGDIDDVYGLIKFINEDSFLEKHIVGLKKQLDGDYVLMPRTLNYKIILGKVEKLSLKFNNYKAFYKKAENDKTLKDYRLITLKYDNQVVCTKR
jgi:cell division protein FtsQ